MQYTQVVLAPEAPLLHLHCRGIPPIHGSPVYNPIRKKMLILFLWKGEANSRHLDLQSNVLTYRSLSDPHVLILLSGFVINIVIVCDSSHYSHAHVIRATPA